MLGWVGRNQLRIEFLLVPNVGCLEIVLKWKSILKAGHSYSTYILVTIYISTWSGSPLKLLHAYPITQASIWMRMNSIHLRESRCNWLRWDEDAIHWCWTYDGWLCILGSSWEADANLQCREMAASFWFNALLVCGHFRSRWNEEVKLWNRNRGASFAVDSFNQVQTCQLSALQL